MVLQQLRLAGRRLVHHAIVLVAAVALTLLCFLVLPVIQAVGKKSNNSVVLASVDTGALPPPPPPPPPEEPEEEEEPEPEPDPLELDEAPPVGLDDLLSGLNAGVGSGATLQIRMPGRGRGDREDGELGNQIDFDQKPRLQRSGMPRMSAAMRKKTPGSVKLTYTVTERGKVVDIVVESSTDPVFERPTIDAVRRWKYAPGKRGGKPSRFRIRKAVTFPKR